MPLDIYCPEGSQGRYGIDRGRLCVGTLHKSMAKGRVTPNNISIALAGSSAAEFGTGLEKLCRQKVWDKALKSPSPISCI